MHENDGHLIALYRKGDVQALEVLVGRYRSQLFGFILNMTHGTVDADEVFQEVWLRVIKKIDSYKHRYFLAWLIQIARNLIIDEWRADKHVISLDGSGRDGQAALADKLADTRPGPAERAGTADLKDRIAEAVAQLPVEQKEVVVMRMNSEMPFKDIARAQGVSINTALARMQYALGKLQRVLGPNKEDL